MLKFFFIADEWLRLTMSGNHGEIGFKHPHGSPDVKNGCSLAYGSMITRPVGGDGGEIIKSNFKGELYDCFEFLETKKLCLILKIN